MLDLALDKPGLLGHFSSLRPLPLIPDMTLSITGLFGLPHRHRRPRPAIF